MNNAPLTLQKSLEMAGAVQELAKLSESKIITPEAEARKKGLEAFLRDASYEHASELVACHLAVATEYEPLIKGIAGLLRRAGLTVGQRNQQVEAPAPEAQ